MTRYVLDDAAAEDLEEIAHYIAQDSAEAAKRVIASLIAGFELIGSSPGIGHKREDLTQRPVLFWTINNYLIVYQRLEPGIRILAVTEGSRSIPLLLKRRHS